MKDWSVLYVIINENALHIIPEWPAFETLRHKNSQPTGFSQKWSMFMLLMPFGSVMCGVSLCTPSHWHMSGVLYGSIARPTGICQLWLRQECNLSAHYFYYSLMTYQVECDIINYCSHNILIPGWNFWRHFCLVA